jgi:hypothetical protein
MKDDKAAEAFRKLAAEVKFALGTWEGQYPINDTEKARIAKFFSNRFKSPEEFVAYVFSSPTMQDVMKLLGADGKWLTPRDEQGKRSINKNAGAVRRTLEPVPKYSLLDKFCDLVRSLLGLPKVYKERLDAVIRRNQEAVIENKRAATYVPKTLDERVHELLTDLLATDSAVQNNAAPAKRESRTDNGERNIPDVRLNIDSVATHHALDTRIEQLTGPSGLQAYTTAESAVKKAFKSFMSLHDLVTEYGKVLPSAAEWYKSVRATIATRTKLEADAVNRMQSAISLT